ncbi:acetyl-CoA carboxylase, partial [Streptomyces sp. ZEA17I]
MSGDSPASGGFPLPDGSPASGDAPLAGGSPESGDAPVGAPSGATPRATAREAIALL